MLLVGVDSRIFGVLFILFVVGWILLKIVDSMSSPSNKVLDMRPTCNRCGDVLPTGEKKCISCDYEPLA